MPTENNLSPSAIRTRRYRERRDRGSVVISLEVDSEKLDALVEQGFLAEADVRSRAKVSEAVDTLLFGLAEGIVEINWAKHDAKYG